MQQYKYISFENVSELEEKLKKLQEIKEQNLADTEEFLIITGIPYTKTSEGFGVNLGDVENGKLEQYYSKFESLSRSTREAFEALGVVYINKPDEYLDIRLDVEARRN